MKPLERSLATLSSEFLQAQLGQPPTGWVRADRAITDEDAYTQLEQSARLKTGDADTRTIGAAIMSRYADPTYLAARLYLEERRVPDLTPSRVAFLPRDAEARTRVALALPRFHCLPTDPDRDHPDAGPLEAPALRAALATEIARYLEPAIEPLYAKTKLGRKALWGRGTALSLASLAWELAETGDPATGKSEAEAIAAASPLLSRCPPHFTIDQHNGQPLLIITEGACCRAYRWLPSNPGKCDSCPLIREAEGRPQDR